MTRTIEIVMLFEIYTNAFVIKIQFKANNDYNIQILKYTSMHITIKPRTQCRPKLIHKVKEINFVSSNFISLQIKNQLQPKPRQQHQRKKFINKMLANATIQPTPKASRETTASGFTSLQHSADHKRPISIQNPQKSIVIKQHIKELKNKNSAYSIKWRSPVSKITKSMRVILGEWIMEVAQELQMPKNVIYNALHYVDKYVGTVCVHKNQYQQVGLCSLFIASKLQMYSHPRLETFLQAMDGACTREEVLKLEEKMILKLKFKLNPPTLFQYMILLISLFSHFQQSHFMGFVDISKGSYLWNNIFYTLDAIHLEDNYKTFHNKEKVCLSILYMNIKKEKMRNAVNGKKKLIYDLETLSGGTQVQKNVELFMEKLIKVPVKVQQLKEYIKVFKKWAKYEVEVEQYNLEELKRTVLKQI